MDNKSKESTVEHCETVSDVETGTNKVERSAVTGTVTLSDTADIFLIPGPSVDPRGLLHYSCNELAKYADIYEIL